MDAKQKKYRSYPAVALSNRQWPDNIITEAPTWCSVDLRDGNQALIQPMNLEEKLEMFRLLVAVGFKEIEVGFPSASQVEYEFTRRLIEDNLIPDDVVIQVLTQSRDHLIKKTFEALEGAKQAIVHLYNSTSTLQRRVVFGKSKAAIIELGVAGAALIQAEAEKTATEIRYEYSPESFTGTELPFALEICEAILAAWETSPEKPAVINLPATVEMSTPNIYADQIEWFIRHLKNRDHVIISLHAHNDRGTAVAATELALMAGADRVEGTLFGNGERTGNVDLITLALNLHTQGVDPQLDFTDINRVIEVYERCNKLSVGMRHPYAGELVYTAFSGSHQDAINKGMDAYRAIESAAWAVPYLPMDPNDVGRSYESIIRINSQSGKGGVAYIMEKDFGFKLPKPMHPEFGTIIQTVTDTKGGEITPAEVNRTFHQEYLEREGGRFELCDFNVRKRNIGQSPELSTAEIEATILLAGQEVSFLADGNGPLHAFCQGIREVTQEQFQLESYTEHSLAGGASAQAVSYIKIRTEKGAVYWGAGVDSDIIVSSIRALFSALNRAE